MDGETNGRVQSINMINATLLYADGNGAFVIRFSDSMLFHQYPICHNDHYGVLVVNIIYCSNLNKNIYIISKVT